MANSKNSFSKISSTKLQLAILLCFGLTLLFFSHANAKFAPKDDTRLNSGFKLGIQNDNNADFRNCQGSLSVGDRVRHLLIRDRFKEDEIYARTRGHAGRFNSRRKNLGVTVPVSFSDPDLYEYLARFKVGTPPREFVGLADTGSDLVWLQCDPCIECLPTAVFQTNTSTSFKSLPCSNGFCSYLNVTGATTACAISGGCAYNYTYGLGATSGDLSSEVLTLTATSGKARSFPNFTLGCAHESGNGLKYPILALSRGPLSLLGQLGPTVGPAFSFCFSSYFDNKTTELILGSSEARNLRFTTLVPNPGLTYYYYANATGLSVDGIRLNISSETLSMQPSGEGGVILDTGTSFTLLAPMAYEALRLALDARIVYPKANLSSVGLDVCYDVTNVDASSLQQLRLPTITFHFQNLDLHLPLENSFILGDGDNSTVDVCLAMQSSSFSLSIFGNFQMQNYFFYFDPDNSRVGLKPKTC